MIVNRRRRRGQLIAALIVVLGGVGLFIGFFCTGPTGLFRIWSQRREKARLQRDVDDLKLKATMLESDIDEYQKPEKVKRIAREKLQMKDPEVEQPAKPDSGGSR
jgi:cell division protein FtsB